MKVSKKVQIKYKRILLKFSGEALAGTNNKFGIEPEVVSKLVSDIYQIVKLGVQVGLVIGGGNFFRGKALADCGLVDRVTGDQMGMLATIINALVFRDAFEKVGIDARIMSAVPIVGIVNLYDHKEAIRHLNKNRIVIFTAGTGNPLVTTDSAASLRALEVKAEIFLKATQVDGIYPTDPKKNGYVNCHKNLTYKEILEKELEVMDLNAVLQSRDYGLKIIVFNIHKPDSLLNIIYGKEEGTMVE